MIKKQKQVKKAKVRSLEEIERELAFDPIINKDTMISNMTEI